MSFDLVLKPACEGCGSTSELYGSTCKHTTLCLSCGKSMVQNRTRCHLCGTPVTRLIREYNVRASGSQDKALYIGRFVTGLPPFSKKKSAENKWILHKEGLQGRQVTEALLEKFKNKPWILEDETGQYQYQGQPEGAQFATYYLLMLHGKEFVAMPAGSWYNFNKIAQYKQLTLEEAEEKMSKRRNNATGYERWMMKTATNGAAAFGEASKNELMGNSRVDAGPSKKGKNNEDGNHSDKGEEDVEEEEARKNRLGLNKNDAGDDEDNAKGGDFDLDDDDIEIGDDWEHEEVFTDDDEAVGNDREEREDLAPEIPAPPEIKQDDEDEGEGEDGGLSKSGKELQKLLGKANGVNESDVDDDDDDDDDDAEDEVGASPVLAPKQKDAIKDEPADNSPSKLATTAKSTPSTSKASKVKRKSGSDDAKASNGQSSKKVKTENETKPSAAAASVKDETPNKSGAQARSSNSGKTGATPAAAPVTEDEIRNVLRAMAPVTTQDLVAKFKARLRSKEDKSAFADILRRISKIQKTNGSNYVVLREK